MKTAFLLIVLLTSSYSILAEVKTIMLPAQHVTIDRGTSKSFDDSFTYNFVIKSLNVSISGNDIEYVSVKLNEWNQNLTSGLTKTNITLSVSDDAPEQLSIILYYHIDFSGGIGMISSSWTITVNKGLSIKANFEADKTSGIAPIQVNFDNLSTGNITNYDWNFGDGGSSKEKSPSHTYSEPGEYTVTLNISNNEESTSKTKNSYIKVLDPNYVIADFDANTSIDNALEVSVQDKSSGKIDTWNWDFGDGNTSNQQNPKYLYAGPGNYDIKLLVSNQYFTDSITKTIEVGVKWKLDLNAPVESSPAITKDGSIIIGNNDSYLYSINQNGTINWSFKTNGKEITTPAIGNDNTIYFLSDEVLYALNPNGTQKWVFDNKQGEYVNSYSSPAIGVDNVIYFGSVDDHLYAINPDGTLKWKYRTEGGIDSSPAIDTKGSIYMGSRDNNLYAINPDGTLKWKFSAESIIYSSPAIDKKGVVYFGSWDNHLYAINPDGTLKWKYKTNNSILASSPAIGEDGSIYIGSKDHNIYAINNDGSLKWAYKCDDVIWASPTVDNQGVVYVTSYDNYLYAINKEGSMIWKFKTTKEIRSSPIIHDRTIYFGSDNEYLFSLSITGDSLANSSWPCFGANQFRDANFRRNYPNAPAASFVANPTSGLFPLEVNFSNNSEGENLDYLWDFGDGSSSSERSPSHIYTREDSFTVILHIENDEFADAEIKSNYINVSSPQKCYAMFVTDIDSGPGPITINFTNLSEGPIDTYYWDFGDGNYSTSKNATHTFYDPGYHYVNLIIENKTNKDSLTRTIFVDASRKMIFEAFKGGLSISDLGWICFSNGDKLRLIDKNGNITSTHKVTDDSDVYDIAIDGKGTIYTKVDSTLLAVDYKNGIKWEYKCANYIYSTPAIDTDGTIYICEGYPVGSKLGDFRLYAINSDGSLKWKYNTGNSLGHSPAIDAQGNIYVGNVNGYLYSISSNGELNWTFKATNYIDSSPSIDNSGTIYFGSYDRFLYAVAPNGKLKWKYRPDYYLFTSSIVIGKEGTIYFGAEKRSTHEPEALFAINSDGKLKWKFCVNGLITETPTIANDETILFSVEDTLFCVSPEGSLKWKYATGSSIGSSPIITNDGTIFISGNIGSYSNRQGVLYSFSTNNGGLSVGPWPCFMHDQSRTGKIDFTLDVKDFEDTDLLVCYPNPTNGFLQIKGLPQDEITFVSIFNVMGQKLEQKIIDVKQSTIDLSNYKKGIYFLSFNYNSFKSVMIIKE